MLSSHNEGKCVVAEKFIRTFKNKIDKYMTYSVLKGYVPNWSEEDFVIKKVKNTVLWTYFFSNLNG